MVKNLKGFTTVLSNKYLEVIGMLFYFMNRNKTVKELRKNISMTAKELALKIKCTSTEIAKIDHLKLKELPKELQDQLIPLFRGDHYDQIPW